MNEEQTVFENTTDAGNANRFATQHEDRVRYVAEWKKGWIMWDGSRWAPDSRGRVMELAKETARSIYGEAAQCRDNDDQRRRLARWAAQSEGVGRLKAMVELASTDPSLVINAKELDTDPWLLGCVNCTVDLRTNDAKEPDKADLITKSTGVRYDPAAQCPSFVDFVTWTMAGRPELVTFLQQALGYSLTGDVSERVVFFLHGVGRNGKSTLLKTIRHVMGDYGLRGRPDDICQNTARWRVGNARPGPTAGSPVRVHVRDGERHRAGDSHAQGLHGRRDRLRKEALRSSVRIHAPVQSVDSEQRAAAHVSRGPGHLGPYPDRAVR